MVSLVRRHWRTSFGADASPSSTGTVIDGVKDRWRLRTRQPRPIPSHSHHCQKEYGSVGTSPAQTNQDRTSGPPPGH